MAAGDEFYIDAKSIQRMKDIVTKSTRFGTVDLYKRKSLCVTMANAITDPKKALDRYEASTYVFGMNVPEANIFLDRAAELGNKEAINILADRKIISEYDKAVAREEERNKKFNKVLKTYDLFGL